MIEEVENIKGIHDYWPMGANKPPRLSQIEALNWIEKLPSHIKYILCEIPVGGGKSPFAINFSAYAAKSLGDSYVLTPQRVLQKQYEDSFNEKYVSTLYGKSNYRCESKATNCDIGSSAKPQCDSCPYKRAFTAACYSPNMVLNYTMALLLFKYVKSEKLIRKRKLVIFDECHTLEHHLTEFNAIQIGERKCKQFNIAWKEHKTARQAFEWIKEKYKPAVDDMKAKIMRQAQEIEDANMFGGQMSQEDIEIIKKRKELIEHSESLSEFLFQGFETIDNRYVFMPEKTYFKFKETYGKHIFHDFVSGMADRFLFMSSTILDKDAYCSDLGIDPKEAAFISIDSEFPVENRPVLFMPQMKMSYGWNTPEKSNDRKTMIDSVLELLKHHENENGIIHTGSFQVAEWLVSNLEGKISHRILHHNPSKYGEPVSRDKILEEFCLSDEDQPKLLISPSITEGLDLKHDLGRFAIFVKIPFPFLGDAWIKRRMELSKEWYNRQTMIGVIQGGGRVVRSIDDWGNVYILDESFAMLFNIMKNKLPKWWVNSVQRI